MSPGPLIVSLHLPKTAGPSLAEALRANARCGYRDDYADLPMQHAVRRRRLDAIRRGLALRGKLPADGGCIHGHFLAIKYRIALGRRPARFITWMRDPVQRLASHYAYWHRDYDGSDPGQPLRNRMLREGWTFERFALGPEMRNVYAEYLWGVDLARFDFVGITEHYPEELGRLAALLGPSFRPVHAAVLVNPDGDGGGYAVDPELRARIESHHAADVALYRQALALREESSADLGMTMPA